MRKSHYIIILLSIIALGAALRVLFAVAVPTEQLFDFAAYLELARNISNGLGHTLGGLPVAWQGPLYPYVLGAFFRLTSTDSEMAGKVLNIILSSLTLLLSADVYRHMFSGRRNAEKFTIAAVGITAFLPANIAYVNVLGTEVLFVFLLMLILSLLFRLFASSGKKVYILMVILGVIVGLSALTKPFMLAFPAVLALVFWFRSKKCRETLIFTGIVTFVMILAVAPWAIRNYRVFDRFIPISYNGGYVMFINNNAHNHSGLWMDLPEGVYGHPEAERIAEYLERADGDIKAAHDLAPLLGRLSREWIFDNFGEFLQLGFLRLHATFFGGADDVPMWAMNAVEFDTLRSRNTVYAAFNVILSLFAAIGFIYAAMQIIPFFRSIGKRSAAHVPSMLFFVFFVFFVVVIFASEGQARYAFPIYPLMIYALVSIRGVRAE